MIISPFLKDLSFLPDPKMILIGGTSGSGKSTFLNEYLSSYRVLDVDLIHYELHQTHDRSQNLSYSIQELSKRVQDQIQDRKSFIYPGTHTRLGTVLNRLIEAKQKNFSTAFIFLEVSPKIAYLRNQKRVQSGGHGETILFQKIETKYKYGKKVYKFFETGKIQSEDQKQDLEKRNLDPIAAQMLVDFLHLTK